MGKLRDITDVTIRARNNGHCGVFTANDLALMLDTPLSPSFYKFLHKATKTGELQSVCRNIYVNSLALPDGRSVLAKIALLLHWDKFVYVSLESQLSYLGCISQVVMNRLTVMTTGRSGKVATTYGTIEFTHTKRLINLLTNEVYYDPDAGIFRATEEKAIRDLKRVGRNVQMLEEYLDAKHPS